MFIHIHTLIYFWKRKCRFLELGPRYPARLSPPPHMGRTLHSRMIYTLISSLPFFGRNRLVFFGIQFFLKSDQLMCRTNYKFIWESSVLERNTGLQVEMFPQTHKFSRPSSSMHIIQIHIIDNVLKIKILFCNPNDGKKSNYFQIVT